jgi:hypothetical protein
LICAYIWQILALAGWDKPIKLAAKLNIIFISRMKRARFSNIQGDDNNDMRVPYDQ